MLSTQQPSSRWKPHFPQDPSWMKSFLLQHSTQWSERQSFLPSQPHLDSISSLQQLLPQMWFLLPSSASRHQAHFQPEPLFHQQEMPLLTTPHSERRREAKSSRRSSQFQRQKPRSERPQRQYCQQLKAHFPMLNQERRIDHQRTAQKIDDHFPRQTCSPLRLADQRQCCQQRQGQSKQQSQHHLERSLQGQLRSQERHQQDSQQRQGQFQQGFQQLPARSMPPSQQPPKPHSPRL